MALALEGGVGDGEHADVLEAGGEDDVVELIAAQAEPAAEGEHVVRDRAQVRDHLGVALAEDRHQGVVGLVLR